VSVGPHVIRFGVGNAIAFTLWIVFLVMFQLMRVALTGALRRTFCITLTVAMGITLLPHFSATYAFFVICNAATPCLVFRMIFFCVAFGV